MTAARMTFTAVPGATVLSMTTVGAGAVTVVHAVGDLDMDTAALLTRHVDETVTAYAPALVVVDLADLHFLGAAGVTALLAGGERVSRGGGRLLLRRPSPAARRVLDLTGTLDLFEIETDPPAR